MAKTTKFFNINDNRTASVTLPVDADNKFVLSATTGTGYAPTANVYNLTFSSVLYTVPSGKVARFYPMDIYDTIGAPYVVVSGAAIGYNSVSAYYASVYAEFRLKIGNSQQRSYAIRYSTDRGIGYYNGGTYPSAMWINGASATIGQLATIPFTQGPIEFGENNKYMTQALQLPMTGTATGLVGNMTLHAPTSATGAGGYSNTYISMFATDGVTSNASSIGGATYSGYHQYIFGPAIWNNPNATGTYVLTQTAPDTTFSQNNAVIILSAGETIEVVRSLSATISNITGSPFTFFVSSSTFNNPCRYKFFIVEEDVTIL